jgi:hypothetical protein
MDAGPLERLRRDKDFMKPALLIFALLASVAAVTRVVHFTGGEAIVHAVADGTQHVVIKDAKGNVTSDSYCDSSSGFYDRVVALGVAVQSAARRGDAAALGTLMQYPLRVNLGHARTSTLMVTSRAMLLSHYAQIFTPGVLAGLRAMEPGDVFCRNGMSMLANGTIWASVDHSGAVKGAVVNR